LMVIAMGLSMKNAAPTSQFILLFASASALITHTLLGHPDFYQALLLSAGAYNLFSGIKSTGVVGLITNGTQLVIGTGNALSSLMFWTGTKQLYLGVSTDAPASNNYAGEIIIKEGGISTALHLYTTAWRSISSNLGW